MCLKQKFKTCRVEEDMYSNVKTYMILFGGVFALSTSAIWVKIADAPSAITAFYRLFLTALLLLPFLTLSKERRREIRGISKVRWKQILSAGLFLALHYLMWFESLRFTSIASSTVLVSLQPLFSLALEKFILKIRIKPRAIIGCMISLCGCVVIGFGDFQISGEGLWGDVLAFVAAGVIAVYFFIGQKVRKEVSAVTYSTLSYFSSALVLLVYSLLHGETLTGYSDVTWLAFGGLAVISTIGGQFIFNLLLKKIPASAVTMSILGEPVGTCILACLFLQEVIVPQQFIGIFIIMIGLVIFFFLPERKQQ